MQVPSHRQVIAGTAYDTTTAEMIAWVYDTNIVDSDYEGIKRYLMRRPDGRFFLFSLFGTMSKRPIGQIIPFTPQDAARWCEVNSLDGVNSVDIVATSELAPNEAAV